ncbi:hypothetical protein VCEM1727_001727 [Vibrio cholerae O1 str. EM-1727]|nr:hypothetical protein VIG_001001 [Vibrio cholerae INDRE 91/1]EJH84280.1 hypothetical protein VCCP10303_1564 [Vibrio cholerae CP1030(3)]EMP85173.1 hypothetical protein VC116059_001730 [Vibrio cholerae O1 str. 116059]EMQ52580.1 hypothetical protein VCEM1727_001727 [Vibrio cholerae O1 str. EM-1727]
MSVTWDETERNDYQQSHLGVFPTIHEGRNYLNIRFLVG